MKDASVAQLLDKIQSAQNALLLVGAGASMPDVPGGYALAIEFAETHAKHLLEPVTRSANRGRDVAERIVHEFRNDPTMQEKLVSWMQSRPGIEGGPSDYHLNLVAAWLKRRFKHLVTTNWDFFLEAQIDAIYETAYDDPWAPVELTTSAGGEIKIKSDQLFFIDPLGDEDSFQAPRWDIVCNPLDLAEIGRSSRPVWKIHGSPFLLACPECRGLSRWKRVEDLHVGDPCPAHPKKALSPEMIFWGERLDHAAAPVWKSLKQRLHRCDLIVALGFSGSDDYIRRELEAQPDRLWVVDPYPGSWTVGHRVSADGRAFSEALYERFLSEG